MCLNNVMPNTYKGGQRRFSNPAVAPPHNRPYTPKPIERFFAPGELRDITAGVLETSRIKRSVAEIIAQSQIEVVVGDASEQRINYETGYASDGLDV